MQQLMIVFTTIAVLLSALYFAIIIYYRFAYVSVPLIKPSTKPLNAQSTSLTIIIPARNEAKNIAACIHSILQNNYPAHLLQIIVVDDYSEDETAAIVKTFGTQKVELLSLKDFVISPLNSYKKKAIEIAVSKASGTLIITTDADCIVPPTWLQTIESFYIEKNAKFIAAPVLIEISKSFENPSLKEKVESDKFKRPSLFGEGVRLFQALDFMTLQGITAAVVHKKQMTMCNGANMAYTKEAFDEVGGFAGIDNIASGDDMLLMHKIYKRFPTDVYFLNSPKAIVQTAPVNTIKQFMQQRIRWASKADKYDDKRILPVLVVVYFFNVVMLMLPIVAIFKNAQYSMFNTQFSMLGLWLWFLLLKIVVELFFLFPVANFFGNKSMLWLFPFLQPFHILYTVAAGWLGKFGKYTWKERVVK